MSPRRTPSARLDQAYEAVRAAKLDQRHDRDPAHEDFYAYGYYLTVLSQVLAEFAEVLAWQVGAYPDRYVLRDDAGRDPRSRTTAAVGRLSDVAIALRRASRAGAEFHSAIGHIAVTGKRGDR